MRCGFFRRCVLGAELPPCAKFAVDVSPELAPSGGRAFINPPIRSFGFEAFWVTAKSRVDFVD